MIENYAEKIKHESNGFIRHNGIRIVSVDEERSVLEAEITDNSRNVWGSVHGGFLYTMADTAAGAFARIKYGRRNVTLNGSMNYLRPTTHSKTLTAVGREIKVGRFPFIGNGKAIALGEAEGFIKTVFDAKTGELLGAHMIGAEVTELIQGYTVGKQLETTEVELMQTVFPHPTLSEMMHESVLAAYGRALHI